MLRLLLAERSKGKFPLLESLKPLKPLKMGFLTVPTVPTTQFNPSRIWFELISIYIVFVCVAVPAEPDPEGAREVRAGRSYPTETVEHYAHAPDPSVGRSARLVANSYVKRQQFTRTHYLSACRDFSRVAVPAPLINYKRAVDFPRHSLPCLGVNSRKFRLAHFQRLGGLWLLPPDYSLIVWLRQKRAELLCAAAVQTCQFIAITLALVYHCFSCVQW